MRAGASRRSLRYGLRSGPRTEDHRDRDVRCLRARAVNAVRGRAEVFGARLENVRDERLGIAVDDREPAALDLDHDPVPLAKRVTLRMKAPRVLEDRVRCDRLGLLEGLPVAAAKHLAR